MRGTNLFHKLVWIYVSGVLLLLCGCGGAQITQTKSAPTIKAIVKPTPTSIPTPTPTLAPAPKPIHLVIPSIGVDTAIEEVGIDASGNLETPKIHYLDDVGWFDEGPKPGEPGSAVIDGHLDRPGGAPAVFWNLRYIQVGALVMVTDESGKTRTFQVTRVASYPPTQAPLQDIFGNTGGTFLNLITCTGTWIPSEHQTTLRFVAYTSLVQ